MVKFLTSKHKTGLLVKAMLLLLVLNFSKSWGQILIPNTTPVTENFDAMGTSATAALPANWKISTAGAAAPTWTAAGNFTAVNFQASAGAPATGGRYNWGTTPAVDRALGIMTSGSYASPNSIMAFYQNTNASNLTQLTISYDAERYRINTAAASIQFYYSLDGFTWVSVAAGDIAAATFTTGASAYTFGSPLVVSMTGITITGLNIATNGNFYLRWNLNTTGSNSQGIGIDNVSVTADFTASCSAPTTTISPTTQTLCLGSVTTISISTSAASPNYTWQASTNGSSGWANVANGTPSGASYSGASSAVLTVTPGSTYYYRALVTDGSSTCTATSGTSTLVVNTSPTITTQPTNKTVCSGTGTTFSVAANGSPLTYQWQVNDGLGGGYVNVSGGLYTGGTTAILTLTNTTASMNTYSYQCVVSVSACSSVTSTTGVLTVNVTPALTITPTTQTICINTTTTIVVASSGSSPSYTWEASANGTSGWATVVNGTPSGITYTGINSASLGITSASTTTYYYRCIVTESGICAATSGTSTLVVTNTAPSVSTQPYNAVITTAQTATFTVAGSGSPTGYQWQVNSGSGFSNVSNGGVYSGATTTLLTITNPPISMNSYSYQCILSYICGTSTSSTAILFVSTPTSSNCPQMTGSFINACNGACSEGDNEILFFNSGAVSIPVSPANINVTYGSVFSPTITYTDGFTTNAAYTASLNSMSSASCTTLFVDAMAAGTIPANSVFMLLRNTACFTFDFSTFCPASTVYVLYSTDASWGTGGNFTNGGASGELRYFKSDFSAVSGGCVTNYNYQPNFLTGGDGASISFMDGGGAATAYFNNGCTPPPLVLPIQLLDFYGVQNGDKNDLIWKVTEEEQVKNYIVERSIDGTFFTKLSVIPTQDNNGLIKSYITEDLYPEKEITYYRLSTLEESGEIKKHQTIYVDRTDKNWNPLLYQDQENLVVEFKNRVPKNSIVSLFDLTGKLLIEQSITETQTKFNVSEVVSGIYFVKITSPYKTENFKVVIQKQ